MIKGVSMRLASINKPTASQRDTPVASAVRNDTNKALLEQLNGEVPLRQAAHFREELVGEDRYVGLLQAGREHVDHFF